MCALGAVEGELGGLFGGFFLGGVGVGVGDIRGLAGVAGHEGVEVVEEEGAGDGGEDVAGEGELVLAGIEVRGSCNWNLPIFLGNDDRHCCGCFSGI